MLEARRDDAKHATQVAVLAERRRHQVVALVNDQQVPRQVRRALRRVRRGKELLEDVVLPQVVIGRDDAAEGAPGFASMPIRRRSAKVSSAVDQIKGQGELRPTSRRATGCEAMQASESARAEYDGAGTAR